MFLGDFIAESFSMLLYGNYFDVKVLASCYQLVNLRCVVFVVVSVDVFVFVLGVGCVECSYIVCSDVELFLFSVVM